MTEYPEPGEGYNKGNTMRPEPGEGLQLLIIPPVGILPSSAPLARAWIRECTAPFLALHLQMLLLAFERAGVTPHAPSSDEDAPSK